MTRHQDSERRLKILSSMGDFKEFCNSNRLFLQIQPNQMMTNIISELRSLRVQTPSGLRSDLILGNGNYLRHSELNE